MRNAELIALICKYQSNQNENFENIYSVFRNLIIVYGRRLKSYDDGIQELNLFLIEILTKISTDKFPSDTSSGLQKYIAVAIRNKYIEISKSQQRRTLITADYREELSSCYDTVEDHIILREAMSFLTERQLKIITYKYTLGYSDTEIANILHIKRQTVGKIKRKALNNLRKFLCD